MKTKVTIIFDGNPVDFELISVLTEIKNRPDCYGYLFSYGEDDEVTW